MTATYCDVCRCDEGYALPPLRVCEHEIAADYSTAGADRDGQGRMFHDATLGVSQAAAVKRESLEPRIAKMLEIVSADPDSHYLLWHDLEDERRAIEAAVPDSLSVYGTLDLETREQRIIDFSEGRLKYLNVKPELSGSGCNFQRFCHKAIYLGIGFKFNDFIQSVHRIHRCLQDREVEIHLIYSEAERPVLEVLKRKWKQHDELMEGMSAIIRKYGLSDAGKEVSLERSLGIERRTAKGKNFLLACNDAVDEARRQPENHCDLVVTSIPFSNHYEYTPSYNDFGHTSDNAHFWEQMHFLTVELLRILKPGRLACIHVKDRVLFGNVTGAGAPTISPFHCEAVGHYAGLPGLRIEGRGFDFMGTITVVTDVVRENNQTYRLGWSEQCKDGTKMGVGSPEYVLLFRKPQTDRTKGYADERVVKDKAGYSRARWQTDAHSHWRSSGERLLEPDELVKLGTEKLARWFTEQSLEGVYDYEAHVALGEALDARGALPASFMALAPGSHSEWAWHDVVRMKTLNTDQARGKVEKHICPLQFDVVDRLIRRYTNAGELVYDPFAGLGTVPYRAIKLGRRGQGSELAENYWRDSVRYCEAAEREAEAPTLFDAVGA